ncbi:MAG: dTMP kinase [Candidatus Hodarchaeales archaeon]
MKRKGFLICFTGIDGSGKTTHAKFLKKYLDEQGYSCIYIWGAFRPFFSYMFFGFTRCMNYWKHIKKEAYTDPLEFAPKPIKKKFGMLWRFLILIDYQLKVLFTIRLPLLLGKVVICDRYFYDILMELQLSEVSSTDFILLLSRTMPRSLVTFLLDVSEVTAFSRRNFPQRYFFERRKIFSELLDVFNFIRIDSSKDFLENRQKIRQKVLQRLSNR